VESLATGTGGEGGTGFGAGPGSRLRVHYFAGSEGYRRMSQDSSSGGLVVARQVKEKD